MSHCRWFVILSAVALLSAGPVIDGAIEVAAQNEPVPVEPGVRDWMVGKLHDFNRRLAPSVTSRIADSILKCGDNHALAPDLVLAVLIAESSARPHAYSPKGAIGLMQVMPHMFKLTGLPGNAGHLEANIEAGCLLLADNIRRLGEEDGVSAYFWGSRIRGDGYLQRIVKIRRGLDLQPRLGQGPQHG